MNKMNMYTEIREWYENYVKEFHKNDLEYMVNINLKYDHTEHVFIETRGIATSLNLSDDDLEIVLIIALLHDIGRYEQFKTYGTFSDKESVNHSKLALKIIDAYDLLKPFNPVYKQAIIDAVYYHNVLEIPNDLPEKSELFAKIIRDADKIDIWRILAEHYNKDESKKNRNIELSLPKGDSVSKEIIKNLKNRELVRIQNLNNVTELKLLQLAWIYDINYLWTFQIVSYRKHLPQIIRTLPDNRDILLITSNIIDYVENKAKEAKESGLRGR